MSSRADGRYVEDAAIGLAMYSDTNGLTLDEGRELAERIGEAVEQSAESRANYLPPELGGKTTA